MQDETADGYLILKLNSLSREVLGKKRSVEIATPLKPVQINSSVTRQLTLALCRQGLSVEEIARQRNLTQGTITSHLTELIEAGEAIDVEELIQPEHYEVIVDALLQVGSDALRPIKDFLGMSIPTTKSGL